MKQTLRYVRILPGAMTRLRICTIDVPVEDMEEDYKAVLLAIFPGQQRDGFVCTGATSEMVGFSLREDVNPRHSSERGVRNILHDFLYRVGLCMPEHIFALPLSSTVIVGRSGDMALRNLEREETDTLSAVFDALMEEVRLEKPLKRSARQREEDDARCDAKKLRTFSPDAVPPPLPNGKE